MLLERLDQAGLARRKGETIEAHRDYLARLANALAYMHPENLVTLAELVMAEAPVHRGVAVWPSEAVVRHLAKSLQRPPLEEARIVTSWLASIEGPAAEAGGYAVELLGFLIERGRPPGEWDMRKIREEAEANHRQAAAIRRRIRDDVASAEDMAWLEARQRAGARVQSVIDGGKATRAAKAQEAAAEAGAIAEAAR